MLSMRLQRTGRRGLAQFRLIVQDSRRSPTSGRIVARLGHYNPHTKENGFKLELAKQYLDNGAQPSARVTKLLSDSGLKLPAWVAKPKVKKANPKRQQETTKEAPAPDKDAKPAETSQSAETTKEAPAPDKDDKPAETSQSAETTDDKAASKDDQPVAKPEQQASTEAAKAESNQETKAS